MRNRGEERREEGRRAEEREGGRSGVRGIGEERRGEERKIVG